MVSAAILRKAPRPVPVGDLVHHTCEERAAACGPRIDDSRVPSSPHCYRRDHMTMPQSDSVVSPSVDRATFENLYAAPAPWDIGKPQGTFAAIADRVTSPVLDAGCGTGEHALFFAARGLRVTGIDFVEEAIQRARRKAGERGLAAEFLVKDALTLGDWGERFASVIDSGLFHVFSDDDRRR